MALQNRVTPLGELIATPERGSVYGNRGCLHDEAGRIRRRYNGKRWIACRLRFRGRHRGSMMQPGRYTELFFLDEATAMAAGHRPCAECRREDYDRFGEIWVERGLGAPGADAIDVRLHEERVDWRREDTACTDRRCGRCRTERSCSTTMGRGSYSEMSCSAGRPAATPNAGRGQARTQRR